MFKTSKPLIGTPGDSRRAKHFEFTPIGYSKAQDENRDPKTNTITRPSRLNPLSNNKRNPFDDSPSANSVRGGSSFIELESFDTIHYSDNKQTTKQKSSSPVPNGFDNHDLLNNGSNPVRQQQELASKLQNENYNLKVKIASLTRFLNSITNNEQQEIYQQNSELQEKMIEMRGEISLLNQELANSKNGDNPKEEVESERYREEIRSLNKTIKELQESNESKKELEKEVRKLHQIIEELEQEQVKTRQNSISPSYVEKLEEQLDDIKGRLYDAESQLNRQNEELDEKDDKIERMEESLKNVKSLSDQNQDDAEYEIDELRETINEKESKIRSLTKSLADCEEELKELKSNQNALSGIKHDRQINELKAQRAQILDDSKMLKLKLSKTQQELSSSQQQLRELKRMNAEQEEHIDELKRVSSSNKKTEHSIETLQQKIRSLEKDVHSISLERDILQNQLAKSDQEVIALKNNNERTYKAYIELKKASGSQKKTDNISQNDEYWRSEIEALSNQISSLNVENMKLSKKLQSEAISKSTNFDNYEKQEIKNLAARCNDLQTELSEKDNYISRVSNKYKQEIEHYKSLVREKEDDLQKMSSELRSMKLSTTQQIDDEKLEAFKIQSSKEYQLKALKIELNSLKEEHEAEVKSYKKLIERLKNTSPGQDPESYKSRLSHAADETNEFLKKINDKNLKIRALTNAVTEAEVNLDLLKKEIIKLEKTKTTLLDDNRLLESKIDSLSDQLISQKREADLLISKASANSEYDLKRELKLKEKLLRDSDMEFNEMKHELIGKYRAVQEEKISLEKKIDKLSKQYRQIQMTFQGKSNSTKELMFLQDQSDFYKMKYNKCTYVINDLKFMNSFIMKSIQATNTHIKEDVKKLQNAGVYPDYGLICNNKPSLKVLFKFVVAAIRIKRKTEHSSLRNKKFENLKFKLQIKDY